MKRFSWIKLIPVLIHLKYWYYNTPSQELPSFPYHLFNTSLHVFHLFPYFVLPNLTTCHKYWTYWPHDKPSHSNLLSSYIQIIKTYGQHATHQEAEPLGATCLSKLDNMVNKNSIFNKNVQNSLQNGKRSLISQTCLCIQPLLRSSPKVHCSTSANFHLPIPSYLFTKPSLQSLLTLFFSIIGGYFSGTLTKNKILCYQVII